ncbi:MAG: FadR family transcriptional regulator [Chloroflexia bacterium]|nr:FadR family transcriptional regulator [Chloroflexia bacterium]
MTGQTSSTISTKDGLTAALEAAIVGGRLTPGTKLPSEREMAERHRVSRPAVREAIRGLVERDLLEVVPGRGAFVRHARSSDAATRMDTLLRRQQPTPRHMVEARLALEGTTAALAAERAEAADLTAIAAALDAFDEADGLLEQVRHDLAFHLAVARAAHNPVVETMFLAIAGLTAELMLRSLADPLTPPASLPYHRAVFDAIRDKTPGRARQAMTDHLQVAARTYGADFDRSLESVARRELVRLLDPEVGLDALLAVLPAAAEAADGHP